jgi:parvulin-like peptidyl-prolyl isomerase
MTKRSQGGLPKDIQKKPVEPAAPDPKEKKARLSREYKSRAEREAEIQRWVILGTGVVVGIVLIVLLAAIVVDVVINPNRAVATVNGEKITVAEFQSRVRLERELSIQQVNNAIQFYRNYGLTDDQISQQMQSDQQVSKLLSELRVPDQMGLKVIDNLVEDKLIRQQASAKGVKVTQEQIQKQINTFFGYQPEPPKPEATGEATAEATATVTPTATITPTPFVSPTPTTVPTSTSTPQFTATPTTTPLPTLPPTATLTGTERADQFNTSKTGFFNTWKQDAKLSDADINTYFESLALREALRDAIATDVQKTGPFVDARHILVETEDEAKDILNALKAGESFSDLAKAVSKDTGSGAKGGELGWNPTTTYVQEFGDAVKTGEIGAFLGPIKTQFGYHIIQVRAREDRELTTDQQTNAKNNAFATWLKNLKDADKDKINTDSATWINFVPNEPANPFQ